MSRVADQGQSLVGDPRRVMEAQREGRAGRRHLDLSEESAHRRLCLSGELLVAQRHPPRCVILRHRPDDRGSRALRIVVHRKQCERSGRKEDLIGGIAVRPLVAEGRDHGHMLIFPASDGDSCGLSRRGMAPVDCSEDRCAELAPVFQLYGHAVCPALDRSSGGFPQKPQVPAGFGARLQRGTQVPVLMHGWVDIGRRFVPAPERNYTWWSYRSPDWTKNDRGRRLDHMWVSPDASERVIAHRVLEPCRSWQRPSDHVPLICEVAV